MCGIRCGLEVEIENNRIVKVPDKPSPISEGHICRKGMDIACLQDFFPSRLGGTLLLPSLDSVKDSNRLWMGPIISVLSW